MTKGFDFDVDTKEFQRQIDEYVNKTLPNNAKQGMEKACLVVEATAKKGCPVDLGQLRASITHDVEEQGREIVGYVGTNLEYGVYVHEGTGVFAKDGNGRQTPWFYRDRKGKLIRTIGQKPNPFLKRAVTENKENIKAILRKAIL
ncbi:HK97-gp10 family putative phage morphogenesis protein [Clostridium perfringens]|uniref:HK97-gp10 family putative phage morphogenesis protein n=1 Tax=Clostridium perfringens TaxID=1502 RepID=UPI0032DBEEE6